MPPSVGIDTLRLLSLAIDDALARDELDEAFALLARRDEVIAELESSGVPLEGEALRELVAMNDRLMLRIRGQQSRVADAARVNANAAKVAKVYAN